MHDKYLSAIKNFEGFGQAAAWDYAQHSNGYGTRALYPGERIDKAEANRRFADEIAEARRFVEQQAPGWDEGTKAALTSLTFNTGTRWASSGLGEAVRNLDLDQMRTRFLAYTKAGGTDLSGLVSRRLEEVTWIGQPAGSTAPRPGSTDGSENMEQGSVAIIETAPQPASALADMASLDRPGPVGAVSSNEIENAAAVAPPTTSQSVAALSHDLLLMLLELRELAPQFRTVG